MSSSRMEQVFYHTHSKVSRYCLRHTTYRQRSILEHAALGLAVCGFCIVILSHRTFVHREDNNTSAVERFVLHHNPEIYNNGIVDASYCTQDGDRGSCGASDEKVMAAAAATPTATTTGVTSSNESGWFVWDLIGEGRGVSMYSIMVQLARCAVARYREYNSWKSDKDESSASKSNYSLSSSSSVSYSWSGMKKIPTSCLKSIPGFRQDADVNHIVFLQFDESKLNRSNSPADDDDSAIDDNDETRLSRAFTIHRGWGRKSHPKDEQIVTGRFSSAHTTSSSSSRNNSTRHHAHSCVIGHSSTQPQGITTRRRMPLIGRVVARDQTALPTHDDDIDEVCSEDVSSFLAQYGYLSTRFHGSSPPEQSHQSFILTEQQQQQQSHQSLPQPHPHQYSPIIYSYSHSQGLLRLQPSLQHKHNISTQFIIASASDPNCFGEPFTQNIVFHWVGYDTVVLNWILGLQHLPPRPRFVYHWKTRKELDLDMYDMDHYAFSSRKAGEDGANVAGRGAYERIMFSSSSYMLPSALQQLESIMTQVQKYPLVRLLRFLAFKLWILLSTLLIFFLTTSLVSFTFQETQDRMLEFTLQLQTRVRNGMPLGGLILDHVLENLIFVPIMVGMVFFLIEFYGGDKFLAFSVLSMVWICEVFSAISIRSAQGMHFFPRVFFLYFTLFHVYFFSCPVGFTYASLASTTLFLIHTMIFFWNRYELPALHAGLITPQIPRMPRLGMDRVRVDGEVDGIISSPPRLQSFSQRMVNTQRIEPPPQIPNVSTADDRSPHTAVTAPLSSTFDITPHSDQQSLFPPTYPGPMRSYVAAASTSLQSIRSFASIQSLLSNAAGRDSPNLIFQGGYSFNDSGSVADDSEDDSYIARVMSS